MSLVGNFSTCSVCGKRRIIAKQLNKVLSKQNRDNVYLECKECYRNSNLGYKYKRWKSKDIWSLSVKIIFSKNLWKSFSSRLILRFLNTDCGLEAHIMMTARTSTITALSSISASPVHQSWAHPCNVFNVFRPNISSYKQLGWCSFRRLLCPSLFWIFINFLYRSHVLIFPDHTDGRAFSIKVLEYL